MNYFLFINFYFFFGNFTAWLHANLSSQDTPSQQLVSVNIVLLILRVLVCILIVYSFIDHLFALDESPARQGTAIADLVANTTTAVLQTGTTVDSSSEKNGKLYASAIDFDGNNDYVDTTVTAHRASVTVMCWIRRDALDTVRKTVGIVSKWHCNILVSHFLLFFF